MPAIIIESIIRRPGGSTVNIAGRNYRFEPDHEGRHVAVVEDPDHIARFLQVPEGFRMLTAAPAPAAQPVGVVVVTHPKPFPASVVPESALATIKAERESEAQGDEHPNEGEGEEEGAADGPLEDMSLSQIREIFKAELGRNPSPRSIKDTLIAQIEAVRAERAKT